jgi:hypothetical protein
MQTPRSPLIDSTGRRWAGASPPTNRQSAGSLDSLFSAKTGRSPHQVYRPAIDLKQLFMLVTTSAADVAEADIQ